MRAPRTVGAAAVVLVAALGGVAAGPAAAPADIGTRDFGYAPLGGSPTAPTAESKLWFADGAWWAAMYRPAAGHRIFRLNRSFQIWSDTGTALDERPDTRADTLWDPASGKLYVASHAVGGGTAGDAGGARLYRFSYDAGAKRFVADAGFPAAIDGAAGETLTVDQDSTGRLWATWTQGGRVFVNRTRGSDAVWGTPYVLPGSGVLAGGGVSSLVRFGEGRIAVMWTDEAAGTAWFAVHAGGDGAGDWSVSVVPTGVRVTGGLSLKADGAGRVYAALETAESASGAARVLLAERSASGAWSIRPVATVADDVARPIVVLDEQHGVVHVVMTCGAAGGHICEKTAPLVGGGAFPAGRGTAIIRQDGAAGMDDATSAKGSVDGATGLVVMAAMTATGTYWHTDLPLGAAPAPVSADFAATPAAGAAPLTVVFRDTSTGSPTHWRWDFGDGTTSYARNPSHTYRASGRYTVRLVAARASSTSFRTRVGAVTVSAPRRRGEGPVTTPPSSGTAGTGARRFTVTVRSRGLGGGRVRLSGTVRPRLSRARIVLQVRRARRWRLVRRATLRPLDAERSRFAFVVRRRARTVRYRVVLPAGADHPRVATGSLLVRGTGSVR